MPKAELARVDSLTAQVFHTLGRVMHLNRVLMMRTMIQRGVQPPEAFALTFLSRNNGVTQRELADMLHLSHPRVSIILRALEASGAVSRRPDETDRRLARVFITADGRRREEEQREVLSEYVERTIGALPRRDREQLERTLNRLADRLTTVLREEQGGKPQGEDMKPR
jgi:DNA-binding MarR family transcriptional regulator